MANVKITNKRVEAGVEPYRVLGSQESTATPGPNLERDSSGTYAEEEGEAQGPPGQPARPTRSARSRRRTPSPPRPRPTPRRSSPPQGREGRREGHSRMIEDRS